jgi:sigma-B regulation protein RsbU (phosphoserine phosphatase)
MKARRVNFGSKFSLTTRILVVFVSLSVISLIVTGIVAASNIQGLGSYALNSQISLGEKAVTDSTLALENQAEADLLRLAKDQAAISDTIFQKIVADTGVMADYAARLWSQPPTAGCPSYSMLEKPADVYAASVYLIAPGIDSRTAEPEINLSANMDDIFIPVAANNPDLTSLYIGLESGVFRVYPWMADIDPGYDARQRSWYRQAASSARAGWSELYIDAGNRGLMVTYSRPLYAANGRLIGVLGTDVTLKTVNQNIINTQIGELGYAFLIDSLGKFIARPDLSSGDYRWDESFETENLRHSSNPELQQIASRMTSGETGVAKTDFEGGQKYVAFAPVNSTGWSIGVVLPVEQIVAPVTVTQDKINTAAAEASSHIADQIRNTQTVFIIICAMLILAVAVLAYRLARSISRPLLSLKEAAQAMEKGELSQEEISQLNSNEGQDEVAALSRVFAKMAAGVKAREYQLKKQVEELRIEIDHNKKDRQVAEITDTDYFQGLKQKAKELREKTKEF